MKNLENLKEILSELGHDTTVVLENPSYLNAILGITEEGSLCYSYEKMAQCLMEEDKMDYEEAIEFIDYNTIRAIPYMASVGVKPTIIYDDIINELC